MIIDKILGWIGPLFDGPAACLAWVERHRFAAFVIWAILYGSLIIFAKMSGSSNEPHL